MFDLASLDTRTASEEGKAFKVWRPGAGTDVVDDAGKVVTITMCGRNSEAFRRVQAEIRARKTDRQARDIPETQEDRDADRFDVLCALTKGWSFTHLGDEEFAFTPDNVRRLWSDTRWEWLAVQKLSEVMTEGNFLQA